MMMRALDAVMVQDADWHVFDCPRCGAAAFTPCRAVEAKPSIGRQVGDPLTTRYVHQGRCTGVDPVRKSRPRKVATYGDSPSQPDVLDFRGARREVRNGGGAEEDEGVAPLLHLTPEQEARFWGQVRRYGRVHPHRPELGQCWFWNGRRTKSRYGQFSLDGKNWPAHRVAYAITVRMPTNRVLHTCDRPGCVNPSHLYEGSAWENTNDAHRRGRIKRFRTKKNSLGYRGVRRRQHGFCALITVEGRTIYLGLYQTVEDAARAYDRAAFKYHGGLYSASYPIYNFPEEWS